MEKISGELEALFYKAADYSNNGNYDKAIAIYQDILNRYKDDDNACAYSYARIGDIYLILKKLNLAEDYLRKSLSYDPLNSVTHYLLGFTYSTSRQWDKAIKEFEVSLKQEPDEAEYLRGMGWALWSAGRKDEGLKYMNRAFSNAPHNDNILTDFAVIYLESGNSDKAVEFAERAIQANPNNTLATDVLNATLRFRERFQTGYRFTSENYYDIYEMKVSLKDYRPPIWRRFHVPGRITLYKLHRVLQTVMGWDNYHLYEFRVGEQRYGEPDPDHQVEVKSARRFKVDDVFTIEGARFTYIYDFGDGWIHQVLIERILLSEKELKCPVCIEGKRACPPEDCGGTGGYANLLRIIGNPQDEEYKRMMEWLGGGFDPKHFDMDAVNRGLKRIGR